MTKGDAFAIVMSNNINVECKEQEEYVRYKRQESRGCCDPVVCPAEYTCEQRSESSRCRRPAADNGLLSLRRQRGRNAAIRVVPRV